MEFNIGHVHIKTRNPKETCQYYIDNFGANAEARGARPRLPGRPARAAAQHHDDHRHPEARPASRHRAHRIADRRTIPPRWRGLRPTAFKILEEMPINGRHVCFLEAPDGAQMENHRKGVDPHPPVASRRVHPLPHCGRGCRAQRGGEGCPAGARQPMALKDKIPFGVSLPHRSPPTRSTSKMCAMVAQRGPRRSAFRDLWRDRTRLA